MDEDDDLLWDFDNVQSAESVDGMLDAIDEDDDSSIPEGINENNIRQILSSVRKQYAALQEENSKLLQLIGMVKKKIEQRVKNEDCAGGGTGEDAAGLPMNLEVKSETLYRSEVEEEEDDEDEEVILGGF